MATIALDVRLAHYQPEGGIAQYTLQLCDALLKLNCADQFVLLHHRRDSAQQLLNTAQPLRAKRLFTPSHHRYEQLTLPLELLGKGLDVLHSPDFIPPFRRRCASVVTVHDLAFKLYPQLLTAESAAYYNQIERAVHSADQIIAVSEATRRDLIQLVNTDERKITVIYEAAEASFRPLDAQAIAAVLRKHRVPQPFILRVGTIEPRKNLSLLLHAFRALADGGDARTHLVIAGQRGWLADEVYQLVETLRLTNRVHFLGAVSRADLVALYNAARVFVMPSLYEGFGLPVVEAMACGTPVIVSNVSSLPEIAGDAGVLVNPHNPQELATALARILHDDDLYMALCQRGLQRARQFSWARAARETLAVYHKALS